MRSGESKRPEGPERCGKLIMLKQKSDLFFMVLWRIP